MARVNVPLKALAGLAGLAGPAAPAAAAAPAGTPATNQPAAGATVAAASAGSGDLDESANIWSALQKAVPSWPSLVVSMVMVGVGCAGAWWVYTTIDPTDFVPGSDYAAFAGLFVVALAIERLLEPFSGLVRPSVEAEKQKRDASVANAVNAAAVPPASGGHPEGSPEAQAHWAAEAAKAQANVDRLRASRAVIMWAAATVLAMLAAAAFGFFLLRMLETSHPASVPPPTPASTGAASPPPASAAVPGAASGAPTTPPATLAEPARLDRHSGPGNPNRPFDLLVTGLVVGAGTKPLHDLVSRIQTSKDNATDPNASGTNSV